MKRGLHSLLALSAKELRLLLRDRHGLLVLFAMPAAFILVMSLALQNVFEAHRGGGIAIALDDRDGAPLARQFAAELAKQPQFRLVAANTSDAVLHLTLLRGFSELLATRYDFAGDYLDGKPEPELLRLDYAHNLPPAMRATLELAVRQTLIGVQSDYLLGTVLERPAAEMRTLRYLLDPAHLPIAPPPAQAAALSAVQQSVPAWLIFALFFTVIPLSTHFVIEREQGTLLRLRVLGVPAAAQFGARLLTYYGVNLIQVALMLAIGVFVVPRLGGERLYLGSSPASLWLIASATSLAAIALALLVAVNVRSILQAVAAGGALCLLMAAVGGIMVPRVVMPAAMQRLSLFSPMAWSLDGFLEALGGSAIAPAVLRECGLLLLFALACLGAAALCLRRTET